MPRRRLSSMGLLSCFGARRVSSGKRRTVDPSMIGDPIDFRHTGHMGCGAVADLDMSGSMDPARLGNSLETPAAAAGSVPVPAAPQQQQRLSATTGRYIDLAALRERNFDLTQLSCHFAGPAAPGTAKPGGSAAAAARLSASSGAKSGGGGGSSAGPLDITNCFLNADGQQQPDRAGAGVPAAGQDSGSSGLDLSALEAGTGGQ